ncbi:hypothetical protein CVT24_011559 [Panaeolus cyanescens]|uniref:CoA-transferase family III domain-containing protein n=1 Tax=Panaeolus cyanescens TaxID=181874 RepID=A0A409VLV6_9AGAR|nr:hypothetical protein CVT24_011559 [Panaeolus cyanescens]
MSVPETSNTALYSMPEESRLLLHHGILQNPLHSSPTLPIPLPAEIHDAAKVITFTGGNNPVLPINWRFAESISAIKGFQGAMLNVLMKRRGDVEAYEKIEINVDHASLFIFSVLLTVIDPGHENVTLGTKDQLHKIIPDGDKFKAFDSKISNACTNIYRTKEGKFFHLHGSLNPAIALSALSISKTLSSDSDSMAEVVSIYASAISQYSAPQLETLMNDQHRQAGTTCQSPQEYRDSVHGKANAHVGLYEIHHIPNETQKAGWWDNRASGTTGVQNGGGGGKLRPLQGLKIVDLSRIIAAPTISRELAELGASVMRITSPNVTDATDLLIDLGWGKWNAYLDLKTKGGQERLRELILEADVVVDGYRPGVLEKYGFGKEGVLNIVKGRERGIIYVHENCYGWNGPLSGRSGWQQISDAHCGTSYEFGKAIGSDGPVTPIFPNSDYCTGAAAAAGVMHALIEQAEKGGSFVIDAALNYYSQWLINSVGTYPEPVWESLWSEYGKLTFKASDSMMFVMIGPVMGLIKERNGGRLFSEEFFEVSENKAIGKAVRKVKPVLRFVDERVRLGYNVGFRGNGTDKARWPEDLMTEIID